MALAAVANAESATPPPAADPFPAQAQLPADASARLAPLNPSRDTAVDPAAPAPPLPHASTPGEASAAFFLPPGWERRCERATGRTYYVDYVNKVTSWEAPTSSPSLPPLAASACQFTAETAPARAPSRPPAQHVPSPAQAAPSPASVPAATRDTVPAPAKSGTGISGVEDLSIAYPTPFGAEAPGNSIGSPVPRSIDAGAVVDKVPVGMGLGPAALPTGANLPSEVQMGFPVWDSGVAPPGAAASNTTQGAGACSVGTAAGASIGSSNEAMPTSSYPVASTPPSGPASETACPGPHGSALDDDTKRMSRDLEVAAVAAAREVATVDAMWERMRLDGTPLPHAEAPAEPADGSISGVPGSTPAREAMRQERAAVRGRAVQSVRETQQMVADSLRKVRQLGLGGPKLAQVTADSAARTKTAS